jgi:hypothetical protein
MQNIIYSLMRFERFTSLILITIIEKKNMLTYLTLWTPDRHPRGYDFQPYGRKPVPPPHNDVVIVGKGG